LASYGIGSALGIEPKEKGNAPSGSNNSSNNPDQLFYNSMLSTFVPAKTGKTQILMYCKKKIYGQQKREKRNKPRLKYNIQCKRIGEKRREGI